MENDVKKPLNTLAFQQFSCLMNYQLMLQQQQRGADKRKWMNAQEKSKSLEST